MSAAAWIRQAHRWVSIAFTLGVIANVSLLVQKIQPPFWVGLLALVPLIALALSGLYLFALPYWPKRSAPRAASRGTAPAGSGSAVL